MVQNHLIQLVALTAMEPPAVFNADNFRNEVVKVYESLTPLTETDLSEHIVRGNIRQGEIKGVSGREEYFTRLTYRDLYCNETGYQ